jgi:hypothetical protein
MVLYERAFLDEASNLTYYRLIAKAEAYALEKMADDIVETCLITYKTISQCLAVTLQWRP